MKLNAATCAFDALRAFPHARDIDGRHTADVATLLNRLLEIKLGGTAQRLQAADNALIGAQRKRMSSALHGHIVLR